MKVDRAKVEWVNYWWEPANDTEKDRIVLIGDSVTREIRGRLYENLDGKYAVDLCATSAAITDHILKEQIRFFFESGGYKRVLIHIGYLHGYFVKCIGDVQGREEYIRQYKEVVYLIREYCKDLIFISGTPTVTEEDILLLDTARNEEIEARNKIVKDIASYMDAEYVELYQYMLNSPYIHRDRSHFEREGNII